MNRYPPVSRSEIVFIQLDDKTPQPFLSGWTVATKPLDKTTQKTTHIICNFMDLSKDRIDYV